MTTPAPSIRPIAATPATRSEIGFFGGKPIFDVPLEIVRPRFPALDTFGARFQDALRSGNVTNNGRWVLEFERRLTEYLGVPTATFCNGQTAMMAMLRAAGIAGGEVIVPAFTFSATPHAVRWCNADPVFADVLPDSMCLDPAHVERKITSKTKAILGVDVYGIACEYAELGELARRHGLNCCSTAPQLLAREWTAGWSVGSGTRRCSVSTPPRLLQRWRAAASAPITTLCSSAQKQSAILVRTPSVIAMRLVSMASSRRYVR